MKNVEFGFFFTAFVAIIGALIITAVNEASFNISQVLLTLAFVLITCIYAMRTSDIAKATRAQADASVKMAEEMREQRLSEAQPYLLMRLEGLVKLEGDFDKLINAEEYVTYTYLLLEVGVSESSFLQRANDLWRESNQLLEEANAELLKLYEKMGK